MLMACYNFLLPSAKIMRTWQGKRTSVGERTTKEKCGPKPKLSLPDQCFMVLVCLRLGHVVEDLADCFYVSPSTVSRTFTTWINLMYFKFQELPMWMSRRKVDKHMPPSFRQWYPTTRVIIDATEFFIEKPSSLITKNAPYAWGNFHACAITRFQKPQQLSWAGRGQPTVLVDHHVRTEPRPDLSSQRCCKLRLKLLLHAGGSNGKEDLKADRRVRHYKKVGLQEWPLAGRATIPRVLYGISLCMSLRRRTTLSKIQKVDGRPLPSTSPFTLFARSTEPQVVVLPLSHGSGRGENLVTIARFAKPLCANMHHHVHAVAGALRKPNVAHGQCDGDVIDAEFALRRCHLSSIERIFFFHLHSSLKT